MEIEHLEKSLGYSFKDRRLLQEALTHPSVTSEDHDVPSNQRLEFLGDAVLEVLISERLFRENPSANEGSLTVARIRLIRGTHLASLAKSLHLGNYLNLSESAHRSGVVVNESTLEDALEALFGAAFLDGGLDSARILRDRLFPEEAFGIARSLPDEDNPKGALQELLQSEPKPLTPEYEITDEAGPPHERSFEAVVRFGGKIYGSGAGSTKKAAEAAAAIEALEKLKNPSVSQDPKSGD